MEFDCREFICLFLYIVIQIQSMKGGFIIAILCLGALIAPSQSAQKDYTDFVKNLQQKIKLPAFKGASFQRLAYITDTYGPRMWGSAALEQVISQVSVMARNEGFDSVRLEPVTNFTKWVRGDEQLTLYDPRPVPMKLNMIGLGTSVAGNVKAEVIVVRNYSELEAMKDKVKGKIVCYNAAWTRYGQTVQYRVSGASNAAKYGAVGALVRSVTPDSIYSVHAGVMHYDENYPKIPAAAITVEDAEMFQRMQDRGQKIVVQLNMENKFVTGAYSNNVIFEIKGAEKPNQIILAGGHIDSWDTGSQTGANDDGGGFITVFEAFRLLLKNGYRPKRTLRFIAWSGQEWGGPKTGAHQYLERHMNQINNHIAAFESDLGSTKLTGFGHTGPGTDIMKMVLNKYLSILGAGEYSDDGQSVDVYPLFQKGVPMICNLIADTPDHKFYFKYHHSAGDSMSMMNPDEMDSNVVGIASLLFILADLETSLRTPQAPNLRIVNRE